MSRALFRVLSGVHAGAQIELAEGVWVFGRDESCDIILSDKGVAARHAAFRVDEKGVVYVEPLDGEVAMLDGTDPDPGGLLIAGSLWTLGGVVLTWGSPEADDAFWKEASQAAEAHFAGAARVAATAAQTASGETSFAGGEENLQGPAADAGSACAAKPKAPRPRSKRPVVAVMAVLVVLFAAVGMRSQVVQEALSPVVAAFDGLWASVSGAERRDLEGRELAQVRIRLGEAGLDNVTVERVPSGAFHFTGVVVDDRQRGELAALAKSLSSPAVIDVFVASDRTEPLRAALLAQGFLPEVRLSGGDPRTGGVKVSVYMLSSIVEEKAFIEAAGLVPDFDRNRIERLVLHREDVEPHLSSALADHGVRDAKLEFLPGRIRLSTVLTPEQALRVEAALAQVREQCPVPLSVDVVNAAPARDKPVLVKADAPVERRRASPSAARAPGFKVVGVSSGAIPFVTLSGGEKVFVGGRLPDGFVLEAIEPRKLVLSRQNQRIDYPLQLK